MRRRSSPRVCSTSSSSSSQDRLGLEPAQFGPQPVADLFAAAAQLHARQAVAQAGLVAGQVLVLLR